MRLTFSTFAPFASRASCSSFCSPAGVSSALLKPNRTSVDSDTFSITIGCGAGVGASANSAGSGAGAGAAATGAGATEARGTASHGAAALSGVQSLPACQQRPNGLVATTPALPLPTYPGGGGGLLTVAVRPAASAAELVRRGVGATRASAGVLACASCVRGAAAAAVLPAALSGQAEEAFGPFMPLRQQSPKPFFTRAPLAPPVTYPCAAALPANAAISTAKMRLSIALS